MTPYRLNLFLFISVTFLGLAPISMARSLSSHMDIGQSHQLGSQVDPVSKAFGTVGAVVPLPVSHPQRLDSKSLAVRHHTKQSVNRETSNGEVGLDWLAMVQIADNQNKSKKNLIWMALIGVSTIFGAGIFAGLFYMLTNSTVEMEESESEEIEQLDADDAAIGDSATFNVEQNTQNGLTADATEKGTEVPGVKQHVENEPIENEPIENEPIATEHKSDRNPNEVPTDATDDGASTSIPMSATNSHEDRNSPQTAQTSTEPFEGHVPTDRQEVTQNPKSPETIAPLSEETQKERRSQTQLHSLAIEQTTRLAKIDIIEALIEDLQSSDPTKRRKSIWELGQRGDSRAVQPLVDLLVDSDSKQVSLILGALSEIGTRTLKPMNRALALSLQDRNPDVRKNAIRDVTRIYDLVSQIGQLLRHAVDDSDVEVQETARWALNQLSQINTMSSYYPRSALHNWTHPVDNSPEDLS